MAGFPCILVEIATSGSTLYLGTTNYTTRAADTPANTFFEARLAEDLSFSRSIGLAFWGSKPRGEQNFGTIQVVNADGALDSHVGTSLRDKAITVKRGEDGDAYSTFSTVATLVVDRVEFDGEQFVRFYVKDIGAKLDRALQQNTYPTTHPVAAIRGMPRPLCVGRVYQVPALQTNATGNGQFDLHEDDNWIGIEQLLDQGGTLVEGTGYERSTVTGVYGFERLTAIGGKQVATVLGAFNVTTTHIDEAFTSLANWTETNGGAGGRDASIVSNTLSMVNTAGGADLTLDWAGTAITTGDEKFFFYEFDCVTWTSGYCELRSSATGSSTEKRIDAVGRYTGIIRRAVLSLIPRFIAPNGSNCSLTIDNFKVKEVTPIEQLSDVVTYLAVTKGGLVSGDLNSSAISQLQTDTGYRYGLFADAPVTVADCLDEVCTSLGGAWWINRTGDLTLGRLTAPSGTAAFTFDQASIRDMRIAFDEAKGLSNRILAKRNWSPYVESEIVASLNYVQLASADKDADVTLSNANYTYSAANVGSVRDTPLLFGDRYYFEVTVGAVGAGQQHYIGVANGSATITSYPGSDANGLSYRANGQTYLSGSGTAYGSTWTAADVIGIAIDGRPAAMGSRGRHFRFYARKNGTWQNSSNPDTEAAPVMFGTNATGVAYVMIGGNAAETNSGTVNFGQAAFAYMPPADYMAPAWHRQFVLADFRLIYQSTTSMHATYATQVAAAGAGSASQGIPTLLSRDADAKTECDRWATLYASERFLYTFTALLDAGISADQIEPFDVIEVTYPRFGLSAKKLRVVGVEGRMLGRECEITAWG